MRAHALVAHMGGIDELAITLLPVVVIFLVMLSLRRREAAQREAAREAPDAGTAMADPDVAPGDRGTDAPGA